MKYVLAVCWVLAAAAAVGARELHIGLLPEQNVFKQLQRYEPLGQYLERRTGVAIRFRILPRYGNILESLADEAMDGAFWGSFTGALAIRRAGMEPLARPVDADGSSSYRGYLFVRRDGGLASAADLKGRTMAFVDRATSAGYLFPVAYLRKHGVADPERHFGEAFFAGSHDAAIAAVLDRRADAGCAKNTVYDAMAAREPRVARELAVLAVSSDFPSNALGLRRELPAEVKGALKAALLAMASDPKGRAVLKAFGAREFVETTEADYRPVFELAEVAGIDLDTYQYLND
ncbi:MAG: phosphate/phosphite/phosphonate ABC transporter substrate-binding protein [Thermodesulfobacteriota bacterium]